MFNKVYFQWLTLNWLLPSTAISIRKRQLSLSTAVWALNWAVVLQLEYFALVHLLSLSQNSNCIFNESLTLLFTRYLHQKPYGVRASSSRQFVLNMEDMFRSNLFFQCRLCGIAGHHNIDILDDHTHPVPSKEIDLSEKIMHCVGVQVCCVSSCSSE